jgi:DNA-binding NtrC family response regulator
MENYFIKWTSLGLSFFKTLYCKAFQLWHHYRIQPAKHFMGSNFSFKVFVVDNDLFSLAIYEQQLRNMGCTDIVSFENEVECVKKLKEQPKVIFLDYRTNPQRGIAVLKTIKRISPRSYIIFITGPSGTLESLYSLKFGAFEYIIKDQQYPATIERILQKISNIERLFIKRKELTAWGVIPENILSRISRLLS